MGSCLSSSSSSSSSHKNPPSAKVQMSLHNSSIPSTPIKDKPLTNHVDPPIIPLSSKARVSPLNSMSSYRSYGSRDEMFYDTQGWLESDCEDDFYSVNGDFTPSRGNTPVHHAVGTPRFHRTFSPQVNRAIFEGRPSLSASNRSRGSASVRRSFSSTLQPSGTEGLVGSNSDSSSNTRRKKLVDLFRESMRERGGIGLAFAGYETDASPKTETSPNFHGLPPKPPKGTSPLSRTKSVSSNDKRTSADEIVFEREKSLKFTNRCFPRFVSIRSFHDNKKASSPAMSVNDFKSQKSGRSLEL